MTSISETLKFDQYPGHIGQDRSFYIFPAIISYASSAKGSTVGDDGIHKSMRAWQITVRLAKGNSTTANLTIKDPSLISPLAITEEYYNEDPILGRLYCEIVTYTSHMRSVSNEHELIANIAFENSDIWPNTKRGVATIVTSGKGKNSVLKQAMVDAYSKYKKHLQALDVVSNSPHLKDNSVNMTNQLIQSDLVSTMKRTPPMLPRSGDPQLWFMEHTKVIAQMKLNGINVSARWDVSTNSLATWSRNLRKFPVHNFYAELSILCKDFPDVYFRGEAYKHGISLQKLSGTSRNTKIVETNIEYHIYDTNTEQPEDQQTRIMRLVQISNTDKYKSFKYVKFIPSYPVTTWEEVTSLYNYACSQGYEGLILRDALAKYDPGYSNHHTNSAIKYKAKYDTEMVVTGWSAGKGKAQHQLATWTLIVTRESVANADERIRHKLVVGAEIKATPKVDDAQKSTWYEEMTNDATAFDTWYKGQRATVEFFDVSDGGKPTQPYFIAFRDYEPPNNMPSSILNEI